MKSFSNFVCIFAWCFWFALHLTFRTCIWLAPNSNWITKWLILFLVDLLISVKVFKINLQSFIRFFQFKFKAILFAFSGKTMLKYKLRFYAIKSFFVIWFIENFKFELNLKLNAIIYMKCNLKTLFEVLQSYKWLINL